jgi:hypothetical protein
MLKGSTGRSPVEGPGYGAVAIQHDGGLHLKTEKK